MSEVLFCRDCAHLSQLGDKARCLKSQGIPNLVTGDIVHEFAMNTRKDESACGYMARWFETKKKKVPQRPVDSII